MSLRTRLVVAGVAALASIAIRGERARACSSGEAWNITYETTFDPTLVGEWAGLAYDPATATFGGACYDCIDKARSDDWVGYLSGVTTADWKKVLHDASDGELMLLRARANGGGAVPRGYATSSLWKVSAKSRVLAAIDYVRFARKLEPYLTLDGTYGGPAPKPPPAELMKQARAGMVGADPFLAQRYAFQAVRVAFYQRDWALTVSVHDANAATLAKPSTDLAWSARRYLAGALLRNGQRARANLELARIATDYAPLAGHAVFEFAPRNDADWKEALRLATSPKDKIALWRVVGIRKDGLVGAREILALDPKSTHVALLIVRELTKLELQRVDGNAEWPPDPKELAAQHKAFAVIEKLALEQIQKGGDRPWLMELIAAHVAALRGDLATTRARTGRALAARPSDRHVISQVNASLAIAISHTFRVGDVRIETELASSIAKLGSEFSRTVAVTDEIRDRLAELYLKAGKPAIAELLKKGAVDRQSSDAPPVKRRWRELTFIQELITRETTAKTPFERFVAAGTYTLDELKYERALRQLFDGEFAAAQAGYDKKRSQKMSQDPFVLRIRDSYDADRAKYRGSWTYASVIARLVELDAKVKAGGELGAEAAILIGSAIYNLGSYGIAKWFVDGSHAGSPGDAGLAVRYFKKAHELSANREVKTRAAFLAAKAELIARLDDPPDPDDEVHPPLPKTWYPILKSYKGTRYYKEVLKECGRFARWAN